jgi:hypothetical protein
MPAAQTTFRPSTRRGAAASRRRSARRRLLWLAACLIAGPVLVLMPGAAAELEPTGERAKIQSVRFEFETVAAAEGGAEARIARYRSMTVDHDGVALEVRPLAGVVRVSMSQSHAEVMTAELDGNRYGSDHASFGDLVASAATSDSANSNLHIATHPDGHASVDLFFPRSLGSDDFVLVQEAGGESVVTLTPIGADGLVTGAAKQVGPNYQWNTGHPALDGQPTWASVLPASAFGPDVAGVRLSTEAAQIKVLALTARPQQAAQPVQDDEGPSEVSTQEPAALVVSLDEQSVGQSAEQSAEGSDNAEGPLTEATDVANPVVVPSAVVPQPQPQTQPQTQGPVEAAAPAITQLAMTGNLTEPWLVVLLAMGLIFIGYTVYAAYRPSIDGEATGHDQLDAMGFD